MLFWKQAQDSFVGGDDSANVVNLISTTIVPESSQEAGTGSGSGSGLNDDTNPNTYTDTVNSGMGLIDRLNQKNNIILYKTIAIILIVIIMIFLIMFYRESSDSIINMKNAVTKTNNAGSST